MQNDGVSVFAFKAAPFIHIAQFFFELITPNGKRHDTSLLHCTFSDLTVTTTLFPVVVYALYGARVFVLVSCSGI
jgi:hypothetical protein